MADVGKAELRPRTGPSSLLPPGSHSVHLKTYLPFAQDTGKGKKHQPKSQVPQEHGPRGRMGGRREGPSLVKLRCAVLEFSAIVGKGPHVFILHHG